MKTSVIIPVLNEEKTLHEIVEKVLKQSSVGELILVDDGSSDSSWKIMQEIQRRKKSVKILRHKKNLGKGAAVRSALPEVTQEYTLIQDADLEYNPEEYIKLIKKASMNAAVYGSRLKQKNLYAYHRTYWGNVLITSLGNVLFGIHLTDSYTCYKLIPTKIIKNLNLTSNGFELEAEITAKLAKRGIRIIEVPISYIPRKYKDGKKIKAKDALKGAFVYLKVRLNKGD